jgi:tetratricopeptide (TPR) repeat protein
MNKLQNSGILLFILINNITVQLARAGDLNSDGEQYFNGGNFARARECFNQCLKQNPNDWQALQSIASCDNRLGEFKNAIEILRKSIETGGLHSSQCTIMAGSLEELGQPKQALSWLKLACAIDPTQATNPGMQAAINRLESPEINPLGSPKDKNYLYSLQNAKKWRAKSFPLKVYVRQNIQIPGFFDSFKKIIKESMDQWCQATGGVVSYKLVDSYQNADIIWDYTDRRELCTSEHDPGVDGAAEMLFRATDNTIGTAKIVVLVKDSPLRNSFRDSRIILTSCLHEMGHALGIDGHSNNTTDVMFLAATPYPITRLSQRDKNTIRLMYPR